MFFLSGNREKAARDYFQNNPEKNTTRILTATPFMLAAVLMLVMIFTGGNGNMKMVAGKLTGLDSKQSFATLKELSMNPNFSLVFDKSPGRNGSSARSQGRQALRPFHFGFNTASLETNEYTDRINTIPRGRELQYNLLLF